MNKSVSLEISVKEDKNEEFLAFLKYYINFKKRKLIYHYAKESVLMMICSLSVGKLLMYYSDFTLSHKIEMGILIMSFLLILKDISILVQAICNIQQRKEELDVIKVKEQNWIDFFNDKENRLNLARSLIIRLNSLEKIKFEKFNKEDIDKNIQLKKEDVYNLVKDELKESDFSSIDSLLIEIQNIENNTLKLVKEEQELKQIKNEIEAGIKSNPL